MNNKKKKLHAKDANVVILRIPSWASRVYIVLGLVLIPWTAYLSSTLPTRHLASHWDISWTGLDIGLALSLICTGLFAYAKSMWLIIAASTTGSFLLIDAWFDILTQHNGIQQHQAILMAVAFEIPLALMSYYLAHSTIKRNKKTA